MSGNTAPVPLRPGGLSVALFNPNPTDPTQAGMPSGFVATNKAGDAVGVVPLSYQAEKPQPQAVASNASVAPTAQPAPIRQPVITGPRAVVKAARARIKDIRRELKKHAALKTELAELERLVAAAKTRPQATTIRAVRHAG